MQTQLNLHTRTHTETAAYWSLSDQSIDWKQASKQHKNWDTDDLLVNTISNDNSPSHIHTGHPVPRFGTLLHIQKHRQQPQTYTDTHTHKCRHSNWLIWNSEQGVLVCFWIMSGAGQLWMSLWRKNTVWVSKREKDREQEGESSMATRKDSGTEQQTVWTSQLPAPGLHCASFGLQWRPGVWQKP